MKNRHGLAVAGLLTQASGTAERAASEEMLEKTASQHTRITAGEDKAYDVEAHVDRLRAKNITPHIAVNASVTKTGTVRKTSIDGRPTRHKGYDISQGKRKMIECMFGWGKQHGTMRKTKHRGLAGVVADFLLNLTGTTSSASRNVGRRRDRCVRKHKIARYGTENPLTLEKNASLSHQTENPVIKEGLSTHC